MDPLSTSSPNFIDQPLHPDVATMNSGAMPSRPAHAVAPAKKGPSGIEGFFDRNAATIGGVAGAIGGGLADAASLGALAPLINPVTGAAAGEGIGQEAENKTTGSKTNPFKEALIGGASQAVGDKAAEYVGKGAMALKGGLESNIATKTADKATQAGYDQFSKVNHNILEGNDLNGTMDTLKNLDLPQNTQGMHIYHDTMTGPDGVASGTMRQILAGTPDVDVGTIINDDVTKAVQQHGIGDTGKRGTQGNQLLGDIRQTVNDKLFPKGTLDSKADPNKVFDMIQYAGAQKTKFANADPGTFAAAQHDAWSTVKNNLEDKLYGDAGVDKAVSNYKLAPDDEAQIRKDVAKKGGSTKLADHIINGVNNASKGKDMRAFQYPAVQAGNLADAADKVAKGALPKGMPEDIQGLTPAQIAKLGLAAHTGGLSAIPGIALNAAKAGAGGAEQLGVNAIDTAGKIATSKPVMAAGAALPQLAVGSANASSPPRSPSPTGPVSSQVSDEVSQLTSQITQQTKQTAIPQLTDAQINQILQSSGSMGLRSVEGAIDTQLAIQKQESPELSTEQQSQIADITSSLQGITDASTLYDQVSALGAGVGSLAELGTKIPGIQNTKSEAALKAYDDNKGELAAQIATVLGSGRSSAAMVNQLKSELPSATDSPQTAKAKFSLVISRLNDKMQSTLATPATNTPGQLTNFSGQTVPGLNPAEPSNVGLLDFIGAQ
jgi:hypothetical protein